MIVGKTKTDVDKLWNAFWTGGITNPVTVIEQINYLLFCRRLDDIEVRKERASARTNVAVNRQIFSPKTQNLRWSNFRHLKAQEMFNLVQDKVFPFMKNLGSENEGVSTFSQTMSDAVFLIPKASLLQSAVDLITGLDLDNSDTAGDLYEYLLSKLATSGINGQFRTPRHIIRMMVDIVKPEIGERICDPACGTGGFLFSALQFILEQNTSSKFVQTNEDGSKHGFIGDKLSTKDRKKFETDSFYGYDFDPTMLRVSAMNMWLHGIEEPHISYSDTLSKNFDEKDRYEVVLANPPFKGKLDSGDCNPDLLSEVQTKKTELLFLVLSLRILDIGGRAGIIVPDGVLFGTSNAHVGIRKMLLENNQLEGVVSMPSGVFKPYAGVSTAVLLFTKGGETKDVWFYDMEHDGYSLDDKRQEVAENDIPDIVKCWESRNDKSFRQKRQTRSAELFSLMAPLKIKRTSLRENTEKLVFEHALSGDESVFRELHVENKKLAEMDAQIHLLQDEFNQLSRQFWVTKAEILKNKYDLSAAKYRVLEYDQPFYATSKVTIKRLSELDKAISSELRELEALLK